MLNALLVVSLGLPGIALATSLTNAVVALVFWVRLRPLLGLAGAGWSGPSYGPT